MLLTYRYSSVLAVLAVAAMLLTFAGCGTSPVATVDGVKITEQEVEERMIQTAGEQVLRSMIDRQLLEQAAEERGIEATEEDMAEAIEETKAQFPSEEAFQQELAEQNLSEEEWLDQVRFMVLARKLALHGIDPSDEELRTFFEENQERFDDPATVSLSEIVVTSESEAQEVLQELEAGDSSFAELASLYSISGSAQQGGERPPMPIEQIGTPQITEVAQSLPVGEVSDPIEVGGSWVILQVRDRTQARPASFEADREEIEEAYQMANANSLEEVIQEQIEKTNINIVDPRFQGLNEIYASTPEDIPQFGVEEGHEGHGHAQPAPDAPVMPDVQDGAGAAPEAPAAPDAE